MDGNQSRRLSSAVTSGATKKRRSSILKSHRLTRTPFSELEFKVATPTDSAKSRRVSFSERTDVAEFITNEATTTWKTFYEEHNKLVDLSSNESGKPKLDAPGHIGQRFFEDLFQVSEIEGSNLNAMTGQDNLTEQLMEFECNNDRNNSLPMRQTNFDLSSVTDHQTKLFGDDVTNPVVREMSGQIDINFSNVQPIVNQNDDLDEMLCDLDRVHSDEVHSGSFKNKGISYFSVNLNMTDSSIPDTIPNAKVQMVAENKKKMCIEKDWDADKENVAINPYIASPKENRYTLDKESDKVLVFDGKKLTLQSNEELEKTFQQNKENIDKEPQRKSLMLYVNDDLSEIMPSSEDIPEHNFTIMKDEDLSNTGPVLVEAPLGRRRTVVFNNCDGNMSITQALSTNVVLQKSEASSAIIKTVVYEDDDGDLSMTDALPSKILFTENKEENISKRAIIETDDKGYSNSNVSLTRALSANIAIPESDALSVNIKSVVYDNDDGNLSMTNALPAKMLIPLINQENNAKRRTVVFENNGNDISITQALPLNVLATNTQLQPQRRRTIVFENNEGEVSITEAIPQVILSDTVSKNEKRRTIIFEADNDVSITQALPANIVVNEAERKSIFYGDDLDNISMTQVVPNNIIFENKSNATIFDKDGGNVSITQALPPIQMQSEESETYIKKQGVPKNKIIENKRNTIIFDKDCGNISMTQALPPNIMQSEESETYIEKQDFPKNKINDNKRSTMIFDEDCGNISMTQALPSNIMQSEESETYVKKQDFPKNKINDNKRSTMIFDEDCGNISMTQALPSNIMQSEESETYIEKQDFPKNKISDNKRSTMIFDEDCGNISMTQALPSNIMQSEESETYIEKQDFPKNNISDNKRSTMIFDDNCGNISMTQALPSNIMQSEESEKYIEKQDFPKNKISDNKRSTMIFDEDCGNISMTQALPSNIMQSEESETYIEKQDFPKNKISDSKRSTMIFDANCGNISMTQALPSNIMQSEESDTYIKKQDFTKNKISDSKRSTMIFDENCGNISMTQALPSNIMQSEESDTYIEKQGFPKNKISDNKRNAMIFDENCGNISMTQALPPNIMHSEESETYIENQDVPKNKITDNRRNTISDENCGIISMTQALPPNILLSKQSEKRRTIVFESDMGDISMTQALSENVILQNNDVANGKESKCLEHDTEIVSMPQYISSNMVLSHTPDKTNAIVLDNVKRQVSLSNNHNLGDRRKTIIYENTTADISTTEPIPTNMILKNVVYATNNETVKNADMSINQSLVPEVIQEKTTRKFAIDEDVSVIEPILIASHDFQNEANKSKNPNLSLTKLSADQDFIVYQTSTNQPKNRPTGVDCRIEETINNDPKKLDIDAEHSDQRKLIKENENYLKVNHECIAIDMKTVPLEKYLSEEEITNSITEGIPNNTKPANSIIHDLLDMSNASLVNKIEEIVKDDCKSAILYESKNQMKIENSAVSVELMTSEPTKFESGKQSPSINDIQNVKDDEKLDPNISNESMFCIIKDSDNDIPTNTASPEPKMESLKQGELEIPKENENSKSFSHNTEKRSSQSQQLVEELQNKLEIIKSVVDDVPLINLSNRHYEKMVCADGGLKQSEIINSEGETKKILELLSEQTDEKDESIQPTTVKGRIVIENKSQIDPTRISLPSRQSFITREELLNNISMAQAMLKSRCEDTSLDDTFADVTAHDNETNPQRFSTSIKRTLHFDDESLNDINSTPLKKTAFGESSYMKESKGNVIPSYLQDASKEIKELMHDLVKPTGEALPFEGGLNHSLKKSISTCSNQLQVNLTTSSQIDLDIDMNINDRSVAPNRGSFCNGNFSTYPKPIIEAPSQESTIATKEPEEEFREEVKFQPQRQPLRVLEEKESPDRVLVFDQFNPLNNVLLQPTEFSEVHSYDPVKPVEVEIDQNEDKDGPREEDVEVVRVSAQYNVDTTNLSYSGDDCLETAESSTSTSSRPITSSLSKPMSDQSVDARVSELRDTEVNTVIAMKENKELLKVISSITLVDDATLHMDIDLNVYNEKENVECVISESEKCVKAKKRSYSPQKDAHRKLSEIALKQVNKMQKISYSPNSGKSKNVSKRPNELKAGDTRNMDLTVQQLLTEFRMNSDIDQKKINEEILEALSKSSSVTGTLETRVKEAVSFSSSNNLIAMGKAKSVMAQSSEQSSDWLGEVNSDSSKNLITECDSTVNVLAKINLLPFMGHECEWEECASDAWSFRLLRGRIRMSTQLSHRHEQAARTHVRADTPLVQLKAEALLNEGKNPIGVLCVRFALEAMRTVLGRVQNPRAAALPALLRRCAALSRIALQWARAMHDASVRLAYTLSHDGHVSLKVANIGLRSVWEIRMTIEMVVEGDLATPWPRATNVQVISVVVSERLSESGLRRLIAGVPCDWGHAPRTIWKVFRYLKHLNRIDDDGLM